MLRLGCSQRSYILTGPEDDQEDESELSVTELKQLKAQKIKEHQEKMKQAELKREEKKKRDEEKGIDWGMGKNLFIFNLFICLLAYAHNFVRGLIFLCFTIIYNL